MSARLKQTFDYLRQLEEKHHQQISRLSLLRFCLWQIYRVYIIQSSLGSHGASKRKVRNKLTGSKYSFSEKIYFFLKHKNHVCVRIAPANFNEISNRFESRKIDKIRKEILKFDEKPLFLGHLPEGISESESDKLFDGVFILKEKMYSFSKFIFLPFVLPLALYYSFLLKKIHPIKLKKHLYILTSFLNDFLCFLLFYYFVQPKSILFIIGSYGNEGELAALKLLKVKVIEMQHGHFHSLHWGYGYSKSLRWFKERLLFPDFFLVFGSSQKDILLEMSLLDQCQVIVSGIIDESNPMGVKLEIGKRKPIAVFSNPMATDKLLRFLCNYIDNSPHKDEVVFLVKIHPREIVGKWQQICQSYKSVVLWEDSAHSLLQNVDVQFNCYSTTIYDGQLFGVKSYTMIVDINPHDDCYFKVEDTEIINDSWRGEFKKVKTAEEIQYKFIDFEVLRKLL